jgi:hypothetical protein
VKFLARVRFLFDDCNIQARAGQRRGTREASEAGADDSTVSLCVHKNFSIRKLG